MMTTTVVSGFIPILLFVFSPTVAVASNYVCDSASATQVPDDYKKDVVIIGGGASGAKAAQTLNRWNNLNTPSGAKPIDYVVLEAQNRLGGRILDDTLGNENKPDGDGYFSGGFLEGSYPEWKNVGCHCNEPGGCPVYQVESGAGWFTGNGTEEEGRNRMFRKAQNSFGLEFAVNRFKNWQGFYYQNSGVSVIDNNDKVEIWRMLREAIRKCVNPKGNKLYRHFARNQGADPIPDLPIKDRGLEKTLRNCPYWNLVTPNEKRLGNLWKNFVYYSESLTRDLSLFYFVSLSFAESVGFYS